MTQVLYQQARRFIAGGVNSPVRAFRAVGGDPVFLGRGSGCRVWDSEGRAYIDYLGSWGPLILGHCHPRVVAALQEASAEGISFGMPTVRETELARAVVEAFPAVERVRFVSSGTEATMSALRLARAFTGRDGIIKMQGCYHGHVDALLVGAGSGVATLGIPGSPGVPESVAAQTRVVPFNDLGAFERLCASEGRQIAAAILEPIAGNMGVVPPAAGYLAGIREIAARHGMLFICDEVMTGFRVAYGGAQELCGFRADLVTLGKILGGGLPVAAYGGRADIMERLAPDGPVYQAGTLSGNPLGMAAGIETLRQLRGAGAGRRAQVSSLPAPVPLEDPSVYGPPEDPYGRLEALSSRLEKGLSEAAAAAGVPVRVNRVGSMMTPFFTDRPVVDYETARSSDTALHAAFFRGMLQRGVFLPPSQFEALFVSLAHTDRDIDSTVQVAREVFSALR